MGLHIWKGRFEGILKQTRTLASSFHTVQHIGLSAIHDSIIKMCSCIIFQSGIKNCMCVTVTYHDSKRESSIVIKLY